MKHFMSLLLAASFTLASSTGPEGVQGGAHLTGRPGDAGTAFGGKREFAIERTECPGSIPRVQVNMTGHDADVVEKFQNRYEEIDGFRAVVHDDSQAIVVVDAMAVGAWERRQQREGIRVVATCVQGELIAAAHAAIKQLPLADGDWASAGYDAIADAVIVESTLAVDQVGREIDRLMPGAASLTRPDNLGALRLFVRPRAGSTRFATRASDDPPYKGGARVYVDIPGSDKGCTPGFYIDSAARGRVLVTAGHCSDANGRNVWTGDYNGLVGTIRGRSFPDPDLAVIGGSVYTARSFAWTDNVTIKNISASLNPATGVTYCQFGATSKRICSQYTQLDQVLCDAQGLCTTNLAYTSGPSGPGGSLGSGGDSGGGVFRELADGTISARGTVVGGGCDETTCRRYDHKRQTILNFYNATVIVMP